MQKNTIILLAVVLLLSCKRNVTNNNFIVKNADENSTEARILKDNDGTNEDTDKDEPEAKFSTIKYCFNYSGTIGNLPIQMQLIFYPNSDTFFGTYYYKSKNRTETIDITGVKENNVYHITEEVNQKITGNFELTMSINAVSTFAGTWNNFNKTKNFPVQLTCNENIHNNSISYNYQLQIHDSEEDELVPDSKPYKKINGLDIYNDDGTLLQEIAGFDEFIEQEDYRILLEDVNFDGYLDLSIEIYYPNEAKNDVDYIHYLYDLNNEKFIRNQELSDLGVVEIYSADKEIVKRNADGNGNESEITYKWQNNKLCILKDYYTYENDPKVYYTEYKIVNGKSIKTKEYTKD